MYILAWVIWDKTDNEDVEDSNEECEDYGCIVQLCWLFHVLIHVDVQSSLRNETKTDEDLKEKGDENLHNNLHSFCIPRSPEE